MKSNKQRLLENCKILKESDLTYSRPTRDMPLRYGDFVKHQRVYDGKKGAGKPVGEILSVLEIGQTKCIAILSDNTWQFVWNLWKVNINWSNHEIK